MAQEEFLDPVLPDIIEQWRFFFSVLDPSSGDIILDVGCGTGDAERLLVRDYPTVARVIGVENDQARYDRAAPRCKDDGAPGQVEFRLADGQSLPFDDCSFDRAFCMDTLEWIPDPAKALKEIRRVLKPGGTAVIEHSDFDTQVFAATDKDLCCRMVHAFTDSGPNGQMGRELHGLCKTAGFSSVQPLVYTLINTEWREDLYGFRAAQMMADWLTKMELVTTDTVQEWTLDLQTQQARGTFFYSINRYICRCVK